MATYLVLKHFATFKTPTYTTNSVGQKVPTFDDGTIYRCEFLYLATDNNIAPAISQEEIIEIIVGDDVIPTYHQQIFNLKDRYDTIIEPGPLEIIGIRKYAGHAGKLHHYRLRTKKVKGAC